ncbi:MAG TPA: DUF1223 domain-containing protein [Candidatus Acidoferrum sp.]|jgi:hypothetical protein
MRWPVAAVLVALSSVTPRNAAVDSARAAQDSAAATRKPVLVELFTSEGCSSCPPADALLVRLENEQPIPGAQVIAIEEHVDYWNQQGWTDPYSSSEWTLRQQDYDSKLKLPSPYTPQMIVDGQTQLTGGRAGEAQEAIRQAAQQQKAQVTLTPGKLAADGAERVEVRVDNFPSNASAFIWIAVTEKSLQSSVNAGENAGKDLRHASVLRVLRKVGTADGKSPSFTASPELKLKSNWNRDNLTIVAFAQDKHTWHILGAAAVKLQN